MAKNNHQEGFTLLELIVVIGLMASLAVLRLQDTKTDTEHAKAKQLGVEIYQYNNAVRSYISENPGVAIDPPAGTEWLRTPACGGVGVNNYLPCDFPNVTTFGQLEFDTNIEIDGGGFTVGTTVLPPLVTDNGVVRSDLSGIAALTAGGGAVNALSPLFAATDASFNSDPQTAVLTLVASNSAQNDVWLRTDGGNNMDANIEFNDTIDPIERGIINISFMQTFNNETLVVDAPEVLAEGEISGSRIQADGRVGFVDIDIIENLFGPAFAPFNADSNADGFGQFETGDILANDDLFVDNRVIVGSVNTVDAFDGLAVGAGDIAVGGDAFIDERLVINGVSLTGQRGVVTPIGARDRIVLGGADTDIQADIYWDTDDPNFYVDPSNRSVFNWAESRSIHSFGVCNMANPNDCLDYDNINGTADSLNTDVGNASGAVLNGFANVDNLYIQKHFINNAFAPVDPITGVNNQKDWRWVPLSRILPDYVLQNTYYIERWTDEDNGIVGPDPDVPKPICGSVAPNNFAVNDSNPNEGVPKIVVVPQQMQVNIDPYDNTCPGDPDYHGCDKFYRGGFAVAAETIVGNESYWRIRMQSYARDNIGIMKAIAHTYCYYGHRGTAGGG